MATASGENTTPAADREPEDLIRLLWACGYVGRLQHPLDTPPPK